MAAGGDPTAGVRNFQDHRPDLARTQDTFSPTEREIQR